MEVSGRPRRYGDIAAHHEATDPGPAPLVRALFGLLVGVVVGLLTAAGTRPGTSRRIP